jgi:hypothetical protein
VTLSEALFAKVAAITDLVTIAGTSIYAVEGPRQTTTYEDAVVISFEGAEIQSFNGDKNDRTADFSLICISKTHLRAVQMAEAIVRAMHGLNGTMGGSGGVKVIDCTAREGPEDYDLESDLFARTVLLTLTYEF